MNVGRKAVYPDTVWVTYKILLYIFKNLVNGVCEKIIIKGLMSSDNVPSHL